MKFKTFWSIILGIICVATLSFLIYLLYLTVTMPNKKPIYTVGQKVKLTQSGQDGQVVGVYCGSKRCSYDVRVYPTLGAPVLIENMRDFEMGNR